MGKQGSPRSPNPEFKGAARAMLGMKDYKITSNDPPSWKRMTGVDYRWHSKTLVLHGLKSDSTKYNSIRGFYVGKKNIRTIVLMFGLLGCLFLLDSIFISFFEFENLQPSTTSNNSSELKGSDSFISKKRSPIYMYDRLLNLASSALAEKEFKQESSKLWMEPYKHASLWKPCAQRKVQTNQGKSAKTNGYILVSANGGLNQQRVAICNAVAVASVLNATLVIPKFLYSNVWKDPSQFGDIYQEEYFINILKDDISIVKELPPDIKSLDAEAIGSQVTDSVLAKEATVADYVKIVLPLLLKHRFVHFLGYGNRLGFDPMPSDIQRLRCKCNFHALKFVPKIQQVASLLIKRIRKHSASKSMLDTQLVGKFIHDKDDNEAAKGSKKYLALHLRFEIDMVSYSLCEFGGGENERKELQAYRERHFPLFLQRLKNSTSISPMNLRKKGRCPLTPEEAALVLAGLGFKQETYIYLAGSQIYGGNSRMEAFNRLYPNVVTKENLLTTTELAPFRNFSSQRLRCKCNFHALKFVPKIQQVASLLIKRIRKHSASKSMLDTQLVGKFIHDKDDNEAAKGSKKYLALHLRFEIDMVSYSLCEFGGGENERKELQAYRERHFPLFLQRLKNSTSISPMNLRKKGRCPLTPEEAALVLAGLGFKQETYIYLAGSQIYGGNSRMEAFNRLYPNVVTKENLLTTTELAPFRNFSSQMAALDFIACASADVFAMTDSGSQLSSLVSGFRTYYGGGHAPTLRPNKTRLATILSENDTIGWNRFEVRVKKMILEGQNAAIRSYGRSIYRYPRCPECMCKHH